MSRAPSEAVPVRMFLFGYVPATLFVIVGGLMNFQFATTLGSDELTTRCWQALSVGATIYTALGCGTVLRAWRSHEWARAVAATLVLCLSLSYDVLSAYGYATRQHAVVEARASEAARARREAESVVEQTQTDLERYQDAPDTGVAQREADAVELQIQTIDRTPGILINGAPCAGPPNGKISSELCPQRDKLAAELTTARVRIAQAEAKQRLQLKLADARAKLTEVPPTPPADPRANIFGAQVVEWLPVALLTIGAAFGFFAVSPSPGRLKATPEPLAAPHRPMAAVPPTLPAPTPNGRPAPSESLPRPHRKGNAGSRRVAQRIAELTAQQSGQLPVGVNVDENGWLRGAQRRLATAAGYRNVSTFNRELNHAAEAGEVDLDMTNGTAVRIRPLEALKEREPV